MKRFSITLIHPPLSLTEVYGKYKNLASFQPPLGVCALAAYLLQYDYPVRIIDSSALQLSVKGIVDDITRNPTDLIGIHTNSVNYHVVEKIVAGIKEAIPSQKIVVGGPHMNFAQKAVLENTLIDYSVQGEGEKTLHELVQHLEDGAKDLSSIDGLAYKTIENEVIVNRGRARMKELDNLPFPAVHLLPPISTYKLYFLQYKRLPFMPVETSRGCPYLCSFCETPFGKKMGYYSPEYMVDYIQYLQKNFGVKEIHYIDDTFTLLEKRVFELCELKQKKQIDVSWYCNARVDIRNKEIFKAMKKAGCWMVAIGVETGNQQIIYELQKRITIQQVKSTAVLIRKAGIKLKTFFIVGNPLETAETIEETIQLAKSLKAHYPVFSLMTPYPGTPLWNSVDKYGEFDRSNFHKLLLATDDPIFIPHGLTKEFLLEKQKEAFRRVYLNFDMIKRQLLAVTSFDDFVKLPIALREFLKIQLSWY